MLKTAALQLIRAHETYGQKQSFICANTSVNQQLGNVRLTSGSCRHFPQGTVHSGSVRCRGPAEGWPAAPPVSQAPPSQGAQPPLRPSHACR